MWNCIILNISVLSQTRFCHRVSREMLLRLLRQYFFIFHLSVRKLTLHDTRGVVNFWLCSHYCNCFRHHPYMWFLSQMTHSLRNREVLDKDQREGNEYLKYTFKEFL